MTPEEFDVWNRNKRTHISKTLYNIKRRAKTFDIPLNIDHKFLCNIAPNVCPVFGFPLRWGHGNAEVKGHVGDDSPSLDRIIPENGYVKGNVAWISMRANQIKSSATERELYAVADWLHQKTKEANNGGVRPPAINDLTDTYLVRPAYTQIAVRGKATAGGSN